MKSRKQVAADQVFVNAKVFTVETNQIWADAVAIKDGHMVYVGGRQQKIM